jgi:hypothetical protein
VKIFSALIASAVALSPAAVAREKNQAPAEENICLAIAHRWSGTVEERARILDTPVPDSFRKIFFSDGCGRFQLDVGSLLTWHLKNGNAKSAEEAIRFLEVALGGGAKPELRAEIEKQWDVAQKDLSQRLVVARAAYPVKSDDDLLREMDESLSNLKSVKKLSALSRTLGNYEFLANEYARAATHFVSADLLANARRFDEPSYAISRLIVERTKLSPADGFLAEKLRPGFDSRIMLPAARHVSLAVTAAAINRDERTIGLADTITRELYRPDGKRYPFPDLLTFNKTAYENDGDACQADRLNSLPGYVDRCEQNGFDSYAFSFWYNRSRLELIAAEAGKALVPLDIPFSVDGTTASSVDLYLRRAWQDGLRYGEGKVDPEAVELLIMSARLAAEHNGLTCDGDPEGFGNASRDSLRRLSWAQSLVSPADNPKLYRQIAEAYVAIARPASSCGLLDDEPTIRRNSLILQSFLDQYDSYQTIE